LYPKARALASKVGMTTSELALAVVWFDIADDEEVRATFRSGEWFISAARRIIKLANRTLERPRANPKDRSTPAGRARRLA
jgi:hypothetical protein